MNLKNKKVLVTAGPTWVPIDAVRVISNIASGKTGVMLAQKLQRLGARVTLLLGPVQACRMNKKIRLLRFRYFEELRRIIKKELRARRYDIVIHSAAVSDYRLKTAHRRKVKSGRRNWKIDLVPTPKIIGEIKKHGRSLFAVGFKFRPQAEKSALLQEARVLLRRGRLDLVVANSISRNGYRAYLVSPAGVCGRLFSKDTMAEKLISVISSQI